MYVVTFFLFDFKKGFTCVVIVSHSLQPYILLYGVGITRTIMGIAITRIYNSQTLRCDG